MRKRCCLLMMAVVCALVVGACGSDSSETKTGRTTAGAGSASGAGMANTQLKPYDENAPAGEAPTGLPKRIAYSSPCALKVCQDIGHSYALGGKDGGLEYLSAVSDGDSQRQADQLETFMSRGVAGIFLTALDIPGSSPFAQRAVDKGVLVTGITRPLDGIQIVSDECTVGRIMAEAAVAHIKEKLGGEAEVAYFNEDTLSPDFIPRHTCALRALEAGGPGIRVVSDMEFNLRQQPTDVTNTMFQAHPNIKVVPGGALIVDGAYATLEAQGKADDDSYFLGSVSGLDQTLAAIARGGAYKWTVGYPYEIWAYAAGKYTADWLEGKSVPRAMTTPGFAGIPLTNASEVQAYKDAVSDPRATFQDAQLRDRYVLFYGNVNYEEYEQKYWREKWVPSEGAVDAPQ